jgi:hypothetical protein
MASLMALAARWWYSLSTWLPSLLCLLGHPFCCCCKQLTFLSLQSAPGSYILSPLLLLTLTALDSLLKLLILNCKDRRRIQRKLAAFNKLTDSLSSRAL